MKTASSDVLYGPACQKGFTSPLNLNDKAYFALEIHSNSNFAYKFENLTKIIRFAMEIEGIFYVAEVNILVILII